eukprot:TRINITY_DN199_c0_g2_i7.p1 TRINITY_DN199_c0_g2~~TRINITY_DN199_c0_g2_i7.p1  ORF type:complete len:248 (+),score=60.11 TRINITY_DN199_c0_g2_i7:169-912(+)
MGLCASCCGRKRKNKLKTLPGLEEEEAAELGDIEVVGPVLVGKRFCRSDDVILILKEGWGFNHKNNIDIFDTTGDLQFQVNAKALSLKHHRVLMDEAQRPIASFLRKVLSMHKIVFMTRGLDFDPRRKGYILKARKKMLSLHPEIQVFYASNSSHKPNIKITGALMTGGSYTVKEVDGTVLAEVIKGLDIEVGGEVEVDKDTFFCKIPAGVDTALALGLVCITQELLIKDLGENPVDTMEREEASKS